MERTMPSEVRPETDALAVTVRRAASLMFNEQDLTERDAPAHACALSCEMLIDLKGGDRDVTADVIAILLSASAEATTASDRPARLGPPPSSGPAPA
jgi:hypothetical protein